MDDKFPKLNNYYMILRLLYVKILRGDQIHVLNNIKQILEKYRKKRLKIYFPLNIREINVVV